MCKERKKERRKEESPSFLRVTPQNGRDRHGSPPPSSLPFASSSSFEAPGEAKRIKKGEGREKGIFLAVDSNSGRLNTLMQYPSPNPALRRAGGGSLCSPIFGLGSASQLLREWGKVTLSPSESDRPLSGAPQRCPLVLTFFYYYSSTSRSLSSLLSPNNFGAGKVSGAL